MNYANDHIDISSIKKGTRILFANVPADGHFNPLTGLAVHLKNLGCDVRWYTSVTYAEKIGKMGIPFYGLNNAMDISANVNMEKIFPERAKYKTQVGKLKFDLINVFILRGPEYYQDIMDIYHEFPFEIMIADITFGGIPFVKEKMNIPVINVSVVPLPETSKDLAPAGLGITPSSSFVGKIKQNVLRFLADKLLFAAPNKVMRKILLSYDINPDKANIFDIHIRKASVVLQSGTPGFEYRRSDMSKHIHFAGPLLPYTRKETAARWYSDKLKQYEKVLLVTQGTVEKDVQKLLVPTLEAFKNSDCLVIMTTGGSGTEELRKNYPYDNFIIEDFIPFDDVMPYADVYISNGGYGGVLLGIRHGLPLVVAGVHEGKNEINARVEYFGLGINLKTEKPSVLQIRKAVEAILATDGYAETVARLKEEFSTYNPGEICARQVARLLQKKSIHRVIKQEESFIY